MIMQKASRAVATRVAAAISAVSTLAMIALVACTEDEARPPYALEGNAPGGSPCERAGFRCSFGNLGCGEGSVSAGKSLGCTGDTAVCCLPKSDAGEAGLALDASADGADTLDASDGRDTFDAPESSDASILLDANPSG